MSVCFFKSSGMKVILIFVLFAKSSFELSFNGTCPKDFECYNPKIKLDVNYFTGVWYFQAVFSTYYDNSTKCSYDKMYPTFNPNEFIAIRHDTDTITLEKRETLGKFILSPPNNAKIIFTELRLSFTFKVIEANKDYFMWMACTDCYFATVGGFNAYTLTRERFPSKEIINRMIASFERCGIPKDELSWNDQTDCDFC